MNMKLLDSFTAAKVENSLPNDGELDSIAAFFDALSDVTRLKIVSALSVSSMCVTDLSAITGLNQTTASHGLRTLKTAHIVESKRQGKVMFYSLSENGIPKILDLAVGAVYR
ncbi:MAG: metalloregulator ArsR/SmtB family transcription factor [Roseburia sp.]|nr:metalloregulator ArsR/SmtB family transcription factor [Roseburia sp.]